MKVGDRVTLIGIPPDAKNDEELQTRALFRKCLGHTFLISEIENVDGLAIQLARLNVRHFFGESSDLHTIWVEEKYLKIETLE
jgi:hypothetical protein